MNLKKRGVVFIYSPIGFVEFVWYNCSHFKGYEWDAFCLPHLPKGEYISEYCKKSGIFRKVVRCTDDYSSEPLIKQLMMFLEMFWYFITFRRKKYCKSFAEKYIQIDDYDEFVVLNDFTLLFGSIIGISDDKKVLIFEEGTMDYCDRKRRNIFKYLFSLYHWKGFLLSLMNYANLSNMYPLKTTKHCTKYSSHPEKMKYTNYKEIKKLFDFSKVDYNRYNSIINKTYNFDITKIEDADTIFFSAALTDFVNDDSEYIKKLVEYISVESKCILIKKHPRDESKYCFNDSTIVYEVDSKLPAEILLPYIKKKRVIFAYPTSIILNMQDSEYCLEAVYFSGLHEEAKKKGEYRVFPYLNKADWLEEFNKFSIKSIKIIEL